MRRLKASLWTRPLFLFILIAGPPSWAGAFEFIAGRYENKGPFQLWYEDDGQKLVGSYDVELDRGGETVRCQFRLEGLKPKAGPANVTLSVSSTSKSISGRLKSLRGGQLQLSINQSLSPGCDEMGFTKSRPLKLKLIKRDF